MLAEPEGGRVLVNISTAEKPSKVRHDRIEFVAVLDIR